VEHDAAWCEEALSSILNATAKKIRMCAKFKRWWNSDIKERRKAVARERRRRNTEEAPRTPTKLQMLILHSKSKMCCEYSQMLREAEVWRAA
jgi:hypothetical protein